ncbi:MAG: cytidyltransferase-related domain protein [Clostridia bacterium]
MMLTNDSEWTQVFLERLHAELTVRCGSDWRVRLAQPSDAMMLNLLGETVFDRFHLGQQALPLCRCALDKLSEEPEEGWIAAAYAYLIDAFYPPEVPSPESPERTAALELYLAVLHTCILRERETRSYDPLTDVLFVTEQERAVSAVSDEYDAFLTAVTQARYLELMHLARAVTPLDPLSHTAGVHHVAVHMARQAVDCGIPVDIALVSAAAVVHDIGKFGCRSNDSKRVPYLHYYHTDRWLIQNGLPHIAHVASNHSTWDLEYENLPVESLLLIYADFRVRGTKDGGRERIEIHTLAEAGEIIFGKLTNMVAEKRRRYQRVYHKLCDFEGALTHLGVNPDPFSDTFLLVEPVNAALLPDAQDVDLLKRMAIERNLRLMHAFSANESFERLLEQARSEKTLESIRTYLNLFEEYCTYMTRAHKLETLNLLYELLMHQESDVRRLAGRLMGRILSNDGLQYRKELPDNAPETAIAPTLSEMLQEREALWQKYLELLLSPDPKIGKKHAIRIVNSLKVVVESLFDHCKHMDARGYLNQLLARYRNVLPTERFVLMDTIVRIPVQLLTEDEMGMLIESTMPMLTQTDSSEQVCALRALLHFVTQRREETGTQIGVMLEKTPIVGGTAVNYLLGCICARLRSQNAAVPATGRLSGGEVSELCLMNLKNAVHWIVKETNIDVLCAYATNSPADTFQVATHLSNLLMVSEHLPVREHAGRALVALSGRLGVDQVNELVIDLCRGLDTEQREFLRYVPATLSTMIQCLPAQEQDETISILEHMVRSGAARAAGAALSTLGTMLVGLALSTEPGDKLSNGRQKRILGILLAGLAHFDDTVHRAALTVLCRDVCGAQQLPLGRRRTLFVQFMKKMITILPERAENEITFFNTGAMLNHLYRMMIDCEVNFGPFIFPAPGAVAFFPGTFDPFSSGHKRIVREIRSLGIEVYLAVDEFSWSKSMQPKLLRRQITLMSVADCFGVYLFPDDQPVNLANPADLARLKRFFPGRQLFLVAGSDVIEQATAYADASIAGSAGTYDHILFSRRKLVEKQGDATHSTARERLRGQIIELSLPTYYEEVSSSRIRAFVDKNLEISMLVDPVVESFIHEKGLYLRAPQYKQTLPPEKWALTTLLCTDESTPHALRTLPEDFASKLLDTLRQGSGRAVLLTDGRSAIVSAAIFAHTVNAGQLLYELRNVKLAEYVRMHSSGKVLRIDGACVPPDCPEVAEELANELVTGCLADDHTYALYVSTGPDDPLEIVLRKKGFRIVDRDEQTLLVDMRAPLVIMLDAFSMLKEPFASDPVVMACVLSSREKLLDGLCALFPGELVLSFDTRQINHALIHKAQQYNGVLGLPEKPRRLGPFMCVPYGKILSDVVVPNTVTKALHVEKVFENDIRHFTIREEAGYSPLVHQIRTIRSFNRPVLLVDDLLHNGYRMEKLSPLFTSEQVEIRRILVGILSGRGKDLMQQQGRSVDAVYMIPNLRYWFTESLLYPFIGGDSVMRRGGNAESSLPSVNLILPYRSPEFLHEVSDEKKAHLSMLALTNACKILHTLEQRYQVLFRRSLTLARLGEALQKPRMPDKGLCVHYDRSMPASVVLRDDIDWMMRMGI